MLMHVQGIDNLAWHPRSAPTARHGSVQRLDFPFHLRTDSSNTIHRSTCLTSLRTAPSPRSLARTYNMPHPPPDLYLYADAVQSRSYLNITWVTLLIQDAVDRKKTLTVSDSYSFFSSPAKISS